MSSILLKIWDANDRELLCWFNYAKNGKKRSRPQKLKLSWMDKLVARVKGLWR